MHEEAGSLNELHAQGGRDPVSQIVLLLCNSHTTQSPTEVVQVGDGEDGRGAEMRGHSQGVPGTDARLTSPIQEARPGKLGDEK